MSKTHCVQKFLLLLILVLTFAAPAFADPVIFDPPLDEPLHFQLVANGGPIINDIQLTLEPFVITPNGFWEYTLFVVEAQFPQTIFVNGFDTIVAAGSVKHRINPAGHQDGGPGFPMTFALFVVPFNANFNGNIGEVQQTSTFSVVHGEHSDLLVAHITARVDRANDSFNITKWTLTIDGTHNVPEPATMLLLGTGLIGVAMKMRKKLKHRKSG